MTRSMIVIAVSLALVACGKKADKPDNADPPPPGKLADREPAPPPGKDKPSSLADFLPAELNGVKQEKMPDGMGPEPPDAVAAYLSRADGVAININLMVVKDLSFSKAQHKGLKPGETRDNPGGRLAFKGFEVKGYPVQRTQYLGGTEKSEAIVLLADKVDVMVSV